MTSGALEEADMAVKGLCNEALNTKVLKYTFIIVTAAHCHCHMWFDCVNMIAIIVKCILFGCFISCNYVVITNMVSDTIGAKTSLT